MKVVKSSFQIFPRDSRRKLIQYGLLLFLIGLLDLAAVILIGILGSLAITGVQSKAPTGVIASTLDFLHLSKQSLQFQAGYLGLIAIALLIIKTLMATKITKRMYQFMGDISADLSNGLLMKAFNLPLVDLERRGSHEFLYSLSQGVSNLSFGVVSVSIGMIADLGVLLFLSAGILYINPLMAAVTFILFGSMGVLLTYTVAKRARYLGQESSKLYIETATQIEDTYDAYRSLFVRNQRFDVLSNISTRRKELAGINAELAFIPNISKYVIESGVFLSGLVVGASQFLLYDAVHAVAALALFIGTGTRIAPAMLRIQQGLIQLQSNLGSAAPTIDLVHELENTAELRQSNSDKSGEVFSPDIRVLNLKYEYEQTQGFTLTVPDLTIESGSFVAIVGKSGSGKSTLIDLILGINNPKNGEIRVSGLSPSDAIKKWPRSIAYVPQDVHIVNGTLSQNVTFGFSDDSFTKEEIADALISAELTHLLGVDLMGLNSVLGSSGAKLSGGERQRLGIARAIISNPRILILDEATSALDAQTENRITQLLTKFRGKMTLIVVAHRLSTVVESDLVVYLDSGTIVEMGSFSEVRDAVPDFARQAKLLGL